jgi:hypothetical protein
MMNMADKPWTMHCFNSFHHPLAYPLQLCRAKDDLSSSVGQRFQAEDDRQIDLHKLRLIGRPVDDRDFGDALGFCVA